MFYQIRDYMIFDPFECQIRSKVECIDDQQIKSIIESLPLSFDQQNAVDCIREFGRLLLLNKRQVCQVMCNSMGVPVFNGQLVIQECAQEIELISHNEILIQGQMNCNTDQTYQIFPNGPILHIISRPIPLLALIRNVLPFIMQGNSAVVKLEEHCAELIQWLMYLLEQSRLDQYLKVNFLSNEQIGDIIKSERVQGIQIIGNYYFASLAQKLGQKLGKIVMRQQSGVRKFIVDRKSKISTVVSKIILKYFIQMRLYDKQFIVRIRRELKEHFLYQIQNALQQIHIGNPKSRITRYGPAASCQIRDCLQQNLTSLINKGGKLVYQGQINHDQIFPPCIVTNVNKRNLNFDFIGPIIPIETIN